MRTFLDAARDEKALKPKYAAFPQWTKLGGISSNYAAPETNIHPKLSCCGCQFFAKSCRGRRCGNAVGRHLDESGDSACCRGACRCRKAFQSVRPGSLM